MHKCKGEFSDANFEIGNLAEVSAECFSHHQTSDTLMMTEAFSRNVGKVFRSQSW